MSPAAAAGTVTDHPNRAGSGTTTYTATADFMDALASRISDTLAVARNETESVGWLDTKRAAVYAGCSVTALHKATAAHDVEFVQDAPGGKCWFKREWIDAWRLG